MRSVSSVVNHLPHLNSAAALVVGLEPSHRVPCYYHDVFSFKQKMASVSSETSVLGSGWTPLRRVPSSSHNAFSQKRDEDGLQGETERSQAVPVLRN